MCDGIAFWRRDPTAVGDHVMQAVRCEEYVAWLESELRDKTVYNISVDIDPEKFREILHASLPQSPAGVVRSR